MTPTTRNRMIGVVALLAAGGGLAYIASGSIGENLTFYWTPGEMLAQGERAYGPTIRLGGVVVPGSVEWNPEHTQLKFKVADSHSAGAAMVAVSSTQVPPEMFREGIGVVVEGRYAQSGVFSTKRLMVNHSNEYRPPGTDKVEDKSDHWKRSVDVIEQAAAPQAKGTAP